MTTSRAQEPDVVALRKLLQAAHQSELRALEARVTELEKRLIVEKNRAEAISDVLVAALRAQEQEPHGTFVQTIRPNVEAAVHTSARIDSSIMAEALYPVMGAAMRKMIANLFTADPEGSGRPFVVEQLLLIHRETGLLLTGVEKKGLSAGEADLVSGMLDAIRAFVDDAFGSDEHDGMRDLRVGDVSVLVEWGPHAVLAAVTRGVPSPEFRSRMQMTLEQIHRSHERRLEAFDGRVDPFVSTGDALRALHRKAEPKPSSSVQWAPIVIGLLVLAVLILLAVFVL